MLPLPRIAPSALDGAGLRATSLRSEQSRQLYVIGYSKVYRLGWEVSP